MPAASVAPSVKNDPQARKKIWEMIKDIRIALMVTQGKDGRFHSRPMGACQEEFNNELWFFTEKNSPKIQEIENNPNVLLCYSEPEDQNYVSINGTASIVDDRAIIHALWNEFLRSWFPKGKDDPNIALIRVDVEQAEYWDSPSSTFIHAYGYVKAVLTGKQPTELGDNKKINFS